MCTTALLQMCSAQSQITSSLRTGTLLPSVSTWHGWSWEFNKCLLDTYMNYQKGKFLLVTYVMAIDHRQPYIFKIPEQLLLPMESYFSAVNFSQFHTHSSCLESLAPSPPAKQIFHLNVGLLRLSTLCCSGI